MSDNAYELEINVYELVITMTHCRFIIIVIVIIRGLFFTVQIRQLLRYTLRAKQNTVSKKEIRKREAGKRTCACERATLVSLFSANRTESMAVCIVGTRLPTFLCTKWGRGGNETEK